MKVLLIKTSSLGDIIHTLPALNDASKMINNIEFTWVVEENFREIPSWHGNVTKIIPLAWRRWRHQIFTAQTITEIKLFRQQMTQESYDIIIDGQGLLKSAIVALFASGQRHGFNYKSAREPLAAIFYHNRYNIPYQQHAISRLRQLFSAIFSYPLPNSSPEYGINHNINFTKQTNQAKYLVFLHGTTWPSKLWSTSAWLKLANFAMSSGFIIKLLWYNAQELALANQLAQQCPAIVVLPPQNMLEIAQLISNASAVVALDTGLAHLAAALKVPTVSLYGPTNPVFTGNYGPKQICLQVDFACAPCLKKKCQYYSISHDSPCFRTLTAELVWYNVQKMIMANT
jgi:heptosyltransferase-1